MTDANDAPDGFLARWSRRKVQVKQGGAPVELVPVPLPVPSTAPESAPPAPQAVAAAPDERPALPTLDDVAQLGPASDYGRFVAPDVTPEVRNAALKKLFTDPQFNVMDGLDTYIDDYGKPDPIPASMLRQMVQARALGLFEDEEDETGPAKAAGAIPDGAVPSADAQSPTEPMPPIANDQDPAVRLQPLDAAGPPGDPGGAGEDAGRER
ncbi:MAG: DUF3306 domain-containing protein [Pseudomonadota bacterium]